MNAKPPAAGDTGNDDDSGEPVGNRGQGATSPGAHEEAPAGGRGAASGRNQEQMEQVSGKPGEKA